MNGKDIAFTTVRHRLHKLAQELIAIQLVNADTSFNGDRNRNHIAHSFNTVSDQFSLTHQASAETTILHPIRWATHIQVYFIVAALFSQFSTMCQCLRVTAPKLQCHRMILFAISQIVSFTMNNGTGGDHLGI